MDSKIIAAIITASVALVTSIISIVANYIKFRRQAIDTARLQRKANEAALQLEELKSKLQSERDEDSSLRAYVFEGKKRLYEEYEPIRFQLVEALVHAAWRVQSIARSARRNDINLDGSGWFSIPTNYYTTVVIYDLMLPAVWYRIMRKKLTFVDFSLDSRIEKEYILAKNYYIGFTNDFWLASIPGVELEYDPNNEAWQKLRLKDSQKYWRQGIPVGILDKFLDLLTETTTTGYEPISFGQFQKRIIKPIRSDELPDIYNTISDCFISFHPHSRPVLWRVLIYQVIFAHAYFKSWKKSRGFSEDKNGYSLPTLEIEFIKKYRTTKDEDPTELFNIILKRAQEDLHNAFSL